MHLCCPGLQMISVKKTGHLSILDHNKNSYIPADSKLVRLTAISCCSFLGMSGVAKAWTSVGGAITTDSILHSKL